MATKPLRPLPAVNEVDELDIELNELLNEPLVRLPHVPTAHDAALTALNDRVGRLEARLDELVLAVEEVSVTQAERFRAAVVEAAVAVREFAPPPSTDA